VKYRVDFTPQALEDVSKLDRIISERVIKRLEWLSQNIELINPQALKGKFQGMFKLVVGDWRVIYTADFANKLITVHLVGHRKEVYKI
jgi:mRNA interferase RelE/StbE